jgi:DNA polymerase-3 subunit epsilon
MNEKVTASDLGLDILPMMGVVDIETGGFDKKNNGLCEIGLQIIDRTGRVHKVYQWYIKPYKNSQGEPMTYTEGAFKVNGLSMEVLEGGGHPEHIAPTFMNILIENGVYILIGHNIDGFDLPWLQEFVGRFTEMKFEPKTLDTLKMSKQSHPHLPSHKLGELCKYHGIEISNAHTALGDIDATRQLYMKLMSLIPAN